MTDLKIYINGVFVPARCGECGTVEDPRGYYLKDGDGERAYICAECAAKTAPNTVKVWELLCDKFDAAPHMVDAFGHWLYGYLAKTDFEVLELAEVEAILTRRLAHDLKQQTLDHYAEVEAAQHYKQFDGWVNHPFDDVMNPRGERYVLSGNESHELWRTDAAVRVHIRDGVHPLDAIALLTRVVKWLTDIAVDMQLNGNHTLPGDWQFPNSPEVMKAIEAAMAHMRARGDFEPANSHKRPDLLEQAMKLGAEIRPTDDDYYYPPAETDQDF